MNAFVAIFCLAVASASASWVGHDALAYNAAAHIPSGSVSVGQEGVVIAGPSGSVQTDNGLSGHGAGARLSGPAGEVGSQGGLARLAGPGVGHQGAVLSHGAVLSQAAPWAGVVASPLAYSVGQVGIVGPSAHASIVGPSSYASIVGAGSHASLVGAIGHAGVLAAPAWGHAGIVGHGLQGW